MCAGIMVIPDESAAGGRDPWFDWPFGRLTALSKVEGLTTLSKVEGVSSSNASNWILRHRRTARLPE